jgi:hypothetical protein
MAISVLPTPCDIQLVRDTDNEFEFVLTGGDGKSIGIDLDQVEWTISDKIGGTMIFQKISLAGSHEDGPNGKVLFKIDKEDTSTAKTTSVTTWHHELRRIKASGDERVHIPGRLIVEPTGPGA